MIYYASRTGNVRAIVARLALPNAEIQPDMQVQEPFLLFTYTDNLGDVPLVVEDFMKLNAQLCKGVIVSGNRNFGHRLFCAAGDKLSEQYNIPVVCKIDLRGTSGDEAIKEYYNRTFRGG